MKQNTVGKEDEVHSQSVRSVEQRPERPERPAASRGKSGGTEEGRGEQPGWMKEAGKQPQDPHTAAGTEDVADKSTEDKQATF